MRKGLETRFRLLGDVIELFNKKGTDLTIGQIASELNVNRSTISNHFPKKEDLIFALANLYQEKLAMLIAKSREVKNVSFKTQALQFSEVMDLVFSYRGVISYMMVTPPTDKLVEDSIKNTYKQHTANLKGRIKIMIEMGLLVPSILEPIPFKLFEIQYMTIASTWFISFNLYQEEKDYKKIKPYVLISLFNSYYPHLTKKGKKEIDDLLENLHS